MAETTTSRMLIHRASQQNGPHLSLSGEASAPSHSVRLTTLPSGLEFPDDLRKRISYDPVKKRLAYRGFMSKGDYDRLARLHGDLTYRRALDELFQISTDVDTPQFRRIRVVLVILVVLCLILAVVIWWHLLRDPLPAKDQLKSHAAPEVSSVEKRVLPALCRLAVGRDCRAHAHTVDLVHYSTHELKLCTRCSEFAHYTIRLITRQPNRVLETDQVSSA